MMKKLTSLLLLLSTQAGLALESPHLYRGFYAAASFGGTLLDESIEQTFMGFSPDNFTADFPSNIDLENGSAAGWISVGFIHALDNNLVFSLEAIAGLTHAEVSYEDGFIGDDGTVSGTVSGTLTSDFSVQFRVGYLILQRTHIYGLVGPRWGNLESTLTTRINGEATVSDKFTGYRLGNTGGIGMEHMITDHFSLGLEYVFTSYGDFGPLETIFVVPESPPIEINDEVDLKASTNTVGMKLSYHF